jgi:hypothetical protein
MTRLGAVMSEAIVHQYGRDELLRRLAHPFWFQSFGAVVGMDWHSSGITTSVIGALKRGLGPFVDALIAEERSLSHSYTGRSVLGWEFPPRDCAAVNSAGGHSGSGPISGKRFKFARMTPRGRGLSLVSCFVIVPAVYGLGFCAYEDHPLRRCSLPSRDMLELRQPLTNLEEILPRISFER